MTVKYVDASATLRAARCGCGSSSGGSCEATAQAFCPHAGTGMGALAARKAIRLQRCVVLPRRSMRRPSCQRPRCRTITTEALRCISTLCASLRLRRTFVFLYPSQQGLLVGTGTLGQAGSFRSGADGRQSKNCCARGADCRRATANNRNRVKRQPATADA